MHPVAGALASISLHYIYVLPYPAPYRRSYFTLQTALLVKLDADCCTSFHYTGCPTDPCGVLRCTMYPLAQLSEGLSLQHLSTSFMAHQVVFSWANTQTVFSWGFCSLLFLLNALQLTPNQLLSDDLGITPYLMSWLQNNYAAPTSSSYLSQE